MSPPQFPKHWLLRGLAAAAVLGLTLLTILLILLTEPEPQREAAVKRTPMLVEVVSPEQGSFHPQLQAMGTVRAAEDLSLQPRVSGQVRRLADDFIPGQVVEAGSLLVGLDPSDQRNNLARATSDLELALADLALERGRQAVARKEREQIGREISPEQEKLVLREPQLQAAQATVAAARAALRQAELEMERTHVRAPTRSLVLSREVSVGSLVDPSTRMGRLIAVDQFWVEISLPARQLKGLAEGARVYLRDRAAWPEGQSRLGRLSGFIPEVDSQTRLARLLVVVDDPLGLERDLPPLTAGSFVEATLEGQPLRDVLRIPRELLRRNDIVWVMEEDKLALRSVELVLEDAEHAYVSAGLSPDARIVVTDLATATEGAPLRVAAEAP